MTRSGVMIALAVLAATVGSRRAWADAPAYALVVGFNGSPPGAAGDVPPPLRFADDDAMAFYQLRRQLGDHAVVLAAPDDDTRRRYPQDVDAAQPPTLETLERAMSELQAQMQADVRAGRTPVFSFFYSGHGVADGDGRVALTLLDGVLTQRMLFERVVDRVPAGVIHLIVDACHADGLARARGGQAEAVALSADDVAAYLADSAPGRYLRVGIAIAGSRDGVAHEWDLYQSGVFTHELISALRGAADVNGDRRVEYSELGAFLAAANREVQDPRARLLAIVKAPASAPRAPIADLSHVEDSGRLTRI
ncbi:MAG TPA: caspase family protein, partial [Polyangia bacterium]